MSSAYIQTQQLGLVDRNWLVKLTLSIFENRRYTFLACALGH